MPSAAIAPWPMAVVSRCGRMMSPPAKMPGLPGDLVVLVRVDRAAAVVELLEPGEVDRLADGRDDEVGRDVLLGALDHLDLELRADELRLALRDPQRGGAAVLVLARRRRARCRRGSRCLRPAPARSRAWPPSSSSMVNTEVSVTSAPCVRRDRRHVVREVAGDRELGDSRSGFAFSMWPRRRATEATSIEVSPPPTTTTRLPTWRSRPVVEGLEERRRGDAVRRVAAGHRQRRARPARRCRGTRRRSPARIAPA